MSAPRTDPQYTVDPAGCWLWQWCIDASGYGRVRDNGKTRLSHVVYFERANGPVPDGLELDHLCRVRACVNPAHLEAVTRKVNLRRGAKTKLTADAVLAIREEYAVGDVTQEALAARYGVGSHCISMVVTRKNWRDPELIPT